MKTGSVFSANQQINGVGVSNRTSPQISSAASPKVITAEAWIFMAAPCSGSSLSGLRVYLTRHPKGIWRFAEASQTAELEQASVRLEAHLQQTVQTWDLFADSGDPATQHSAYATVDQVKKYLLAQLSTTQTAFGKERLADILEETGWRLDTIERALKELIQSGKVRNLSAPDCTRRRKHYVHFEKNELLVLA